jgi:hypothetical protein
VFSCRPTSRLNPTPPSWKRREMNISAWIEIRLAGAKNHQQARARQVARTSSRSRVHGGGET